MKRLNLNDSDGVLQGSLVLKWKRSENRSVAELDLLVQRNSGLICCDDHRQHHESFARAPSLFAKARNTSHILYDDILVTKCLASSIYGGNSPQ